MRTETIAIYKFNELSDDAKRVAYENWLKNRSSYIEECSELRPFLDMLKSHNVELCGWEYNDSYHDFSLLDATVNSDFCYIFMSEITGLRATKMALNLYYALTETYQAWQVGETCKYINSPLPRRISLDYVNHTGAGAEFAKNYKTSSKHLKDKNGRCIGKEIITTSTYSGSQSRYITLNNMRQMPKIERSFDGTWLGNTFSTALWDSIKSDNTLSYYEHISNAMEAIFSSLEKDEAYHRSYEYFVENHVCDDEYEEDGTVY